MTCIEMDNQIGACQTEGPNEAVSQEKGTSYGSYRDLSAAVYRLLELCGSMQERRTWED